jgi:hypothetical protein
MKPTLPNLDEEGIKNLCDLFILLHKIDLDSKNAEKGSTHEMVIKR